MPVACLTEQALCMYRGDTLRFEVRFTDANGQPIDITGTTLWLTLKENDTDPDPGVFQTNVVFPSDPNSQGGIGYIEIDSTSSEGFTPGASYRYDFQWKDDSARIYTLGIGSIQILQDITQTTT